MIYGQDGSVNTRYNRLLAKHELKKDSYKSYARQKDPNYGMNKNLKCEAEKKSTYSQISGGGINNFYAYMKDYKNRYAKKKGLAKWDCYYEKKVLNKINNMYEITDNIRNKNKLYNKKIYNKYVIRLILFGLLPFLGTIIPLFFSEYNTYIKDWCVSDCRSKHEDNDNTLNPVDQIQNVHDKKQRYLMQINKATYEAINIVNEVFLCLSFFIVLLILLYVLLKIIKYARIKSGKGKMSIKEYCHFCKDLITAK
ncbi:hypothetical protein PVIIG_06293 [Plasmodium vivax India VII]|uniref:Variable surface protein n=1 Tax=Plasmodium vivax India VII TaxID=1077284 RepID=A0A0J9SHA7_PLAVI|nr:hypothetical protein PVIIG_06293 [Plasmodium vivax India VII]